MTPVERVPAPLLVEANLGPGWTLLSSFGSGPD